MSFAVGPETALTLTEKFIATQRIGGEKVHYRVELDTRRAYLEALERQAKGQSYDEWEEEQDVG